MENSETLRRELTKEEFLTYSKNQNTYKVIKQLPGKLAYAEPGDKYNSKVLFDCGYNMFELVEQGYLELLPKVFPFEEEIVGKNIHSVHTVCPECRSQGINFPLIKECGNCGYPNCITYYDAETINNFLNKIK